MKPIILAALLLVCQTAHAYDFERLADAIRIAEGNPNYGILQKYKTTTPRQACLNTIKRHYTRHAGHACGKDYLTCLRDRYAPIGAENDPRGLNKNWLPNVRAIYGRAS